MWKLLGLIFVALVVFYMIGSGVENQKETPRATIIPDSVRKNYDALLKTEISKLEWMTGGFGSVAMVNVTIQNNNDVAVSDVDIECTFRGESGTVVNTKHQTIYKRIAAKKKATVKELNLGFIDQQAQTMNCILTDLKI